MKLKTKDKIIEFSEWRLIDNKYWFREDLSPLDSDWARQFGHNNAIGFLVSKGTVYHTIPRFFGSDVNFLIEEWGKFNTPVPYNIEEAKTTIDNFIQLFDEDKNELEI